MYIPRNFSHTVTVSIHHWWIFIRLWLCGKCTSQGGFTAGMVPSSKQRPVDGAQLVAPLVPVHYPSLLSYRNLFPKFSECGIVFPINHFHPLPVNDMVVPSYMVCNCTRVFCCLWFSPSWPRENLWAVFGMLFCAHLSEYQVCDLFLLCTQFHNSCTGSCIHSHTSLSSASFP